MTSWLATRAGGRAYRYYLSTCDSHEGKCAAELYRPLELEAALVDYLRHLLQPREMMQAMITALDLSLNASQVTVAMSRSSA